MSERYQCAACKKEFATTEAVDGFAQGYRQGFLCPHCGANLMEAGESDEVLNLKYGIPYTLFLMVVLLVVNTETFLLRISQSPMLDGLATFFAIILFPTILFVWANKSAFIRPRVIFTRKLPKSD